MSPLAVVSLGPIRGPSSRHAASSILRLQLRSPAGRPSIWEVAKVKLQQPQRRWRSRSSSGADGEQGAPQRPSGPPTSFGRFVLHALRNSLGNLAFALSPRGLRTAYRTSPIYMSATIVTTLAFSVVCFWALKSFLSTFYHPFFNRYPKPVANTLRRAIYYTNVSPDPTLALRFYQKALQQCDEVGLDPFSDEVLGIRIQVTFWLESINNYRQAAEVLEGILGDCNKWIGVMEQSNKEGRVDAAGRFRPEGAASVENKLSGGERDAAAASAEEAVPLETLWQKRERLLSKAVSISVKLGELYADEHVLDAEKSHTHLVWAVETSLKEFERRRSEGTKPGEQDWLTPEQLGSSMESLGRDYERKSQFHLAIPLFFQALRLCQSACHRAVIMNNLSAAFAQHPMYSPGRSDGSETLRELLDSTMPATRKDCLEAALNWARNAHAQARDVQGPEKTAECDEACAVALCNWGDVAAMLGKAELARAKYKQCIEMSGEMGFAPGVRQAQEGLAKLTTTSPAAI